jgi:flavin-dependent dehydrogenase
MIGDTAGLIHPLCGNGMAMAIHSAKIASELVEKYFNKTISRNELEQKYISEWNANFKRRIRAGQLIAGLFRMQKLTEVLTSVFVLLPFILTFIIKKTHGKPLIVNS